MRKIALGILCLCLSSASAAEKSNPSKVFGFLTEKRVGWVYGSGSTGGLSSPSLTKVPSLTNYSVEADMAFPISLHFGMRESFTQEAEMRFNGSTPSRGEIYLTLWELGLKIFMPLSAVHLWVGAGYLYGSGAFTNPQTRGNDSYLAAFENETHSIWGGYLHGGFDIMLAKFVGLRIYFQDDFLNTEKYHNLQDGGFTFNHRRFGVGIVGITE